MAGTMKFTIERMRLVRMIELLEGKARGRARRIQFLRLTACAPRVFVEANEVTAGLEALVLADGICHVRRLPFLNVLKTYAGRENITIEANEQWLRIVNSSLAVRDFQREAIAPGVFQEFPVTDGWLAAAGAPKPPAANVPSAAPDETSSPSKWQTKIGRAHV